MPRDKVIHNLHKDSDNIEYLLILKFSELFRTELSKSFAKSLLSCFILLLLQTYKQCLFIIFEMNLNEKHKYVVDNVQIYSQIKNDNISTSI